MVNNLRRTLCLLFTVLTLSVGAVTPEVLVAEDWFPKAPPLPEPTGQLIEASSVRGIYEAAEKLKPGGSIMIADGHYMMTHTLVIAQDDATLRGGSGDRSVVVLDFADSRHGEGVAISHASGVTIADLTVQNVSQNGIKINSNLGVDRATVYNVVSHNIWQRHIKGPMVPDRDGRPEWVEDCHVRYCLFYNDRPKRRGDDPYEDGNDGSAFGYNYVGGIDAMSARCWTISDNVFVGIHGKTGVARGAIFMWRNSRDCLIERNVIIDCDTGIALGNSSARGERRHCSNFVVRNNFVTRCPESDILADHTRDCRILNNTVYDPDNRMGRLLRVVHANDGLIVRNNLFSGTRISVERPTGEIDIENNIIQTGPDFFVDSAKGNLHLTRNATPAIDRALPLDAVKQDIDREERGSKPDIGADELTPRK